MAIALILLFSFNGVRVEHRHQAIDAVNATQSITFNLKTGQQVSGSLNYSDVGNRGTWFVIFDPNGKYLTNVDNTYGDNTGSFSFTAATDGKYYLGISRDTIFTEHIDYEYTVSPAILGLDKTKLIIIVIALGALSAIATAIISLRNRRKSQHNS